ncbi:hypothetical protein DPMN_124610 [Dreissena polymorpha]|uniref:Uncharacterized protein n=1 Tax=Dreissena polymorpha TaxID=45954 RepID=A0A9D4GSY0_DREPO|nr:hypothetical protein DPMN_124610 [Dreissena polymorpha]
MAPDTKVPDGPTDSRPDGRTDGQSQNNIPPPLAAQPSSLHNIFGANLLTKFNEDGKINVASRVKNAPPPGSHVFQPTGIIFELVQDIIGMNLLTKFHEDRTVNVASRVKNAPHLGSHVFQANTNLLTKFHEDWTINVASRELTRQMLTPHKAQRTIGTMDEARQTKGDHKSSP